MDPRPLKILARLTTTTAEDPFGPGDPLEVARLVRRALAAAGRRAMDVRELLVIGDAPIATDALERFTRRALGPHGATVAPASRPVAQEVPHDERIEQGLRAPRSPLVAILLVIGPEHDVTALCVAGA
jgi:hypothetical protein